VVRLGLFIGGLEGLDLAGLLLGIALRIARIVGQNAVHHIGRGQRIGGLRLLPDPLREEEEEEEEENKKKTKRKQKENKRKQKEEEEVTSCLGRA
jgi:hypothetical protein